MNKGFGVHRAFGRLNKSTYHCTAAEDALTPAFLTPLVRGSFRQLLAAGRTDR